MGPGQWYSGGYGLKPPPMKDTTGYEGFRGHVYKDSLGYDTVGFGHKLTRQEISSGAFKNGISREQAMNMFREQKRSIVNKFYENNPQYKNAPASTREGLEDVAYNMGPNFLDGFPSMKKALDRGDYKEAGKQLATGSKGYSKYVQQVKQRGLDNAYRIASGSGDTSIKREIFHKGNSKYNFAGNEIRPRMDMAMQSQEINNAMSAAKLRSIATNKADTIKGEELAMAYLDQNKKTGLGGNRIAMLSSKYRKRIQ